MRQKGEAGADKEKKKATPCHPNACMSTRVHTHVHTHTQHNFTNTFCLRLAIFKKFRTHVHSLNVLGNWVKFLAISPNFSSIIQKLISYITLLKYVLISFDIVGEEK